MALTLLLTLSAMFAVGRSEFKPLPLEIHGHAYYTTDAADYELDEKIRRFPNLYEATNSSKALDPPQNFSATFFEREATEFEAPKNYFYPGIRIKFDLPKDMTGTRGFELLVKRATSSFLVILDMTNTTADVPVEFDLFPMSGLRHYRLLMTSLPLYSGNQSTPEVSVVTSKFGRRQIPGVYPAPANWVAAMRYDVIQDGDLRSLEVVFSRPPEIFRFRRFELALVPADYSRGINLVTTSSFVHTFNGVIPGRYKLMVRPVDDFFSLHGLCKCHFKSGACSNCLSTEMETFTVT